MIEWTPRHCPFGWGPGSGGRVITHIFGAFFCRELLPMAFASPWAEHARWLKTPWGWPVYSNEHTRIILFVFRRRGICSDYHGKEVRARPHFVPGNA
jgi:hypothetical protein